MFSDRRLPIAALVCAAGMLLAGAPAPAQLPQPPAAAPAGIDEQLLKKGEQLSNEGKHAEAAAAYEDLAKRFPVSPLVPEANFRAGYAHYNSGNYDKAEAAFKKVLDDKKSPPPLLELALSLTPQVLATKAAKLPATDPNRGKALEEAVKQFDAYLTKYPNSEEAESVSYGKAMTLYQLAKYADAIAVLRASMQKFAASPTVQDSQYLLALTIATSASVAAQNAPGENKAAEAQYNEAEQLLRDIIAKRQNLALANDAQLQIGELMLARAGVVADKEKQAAMMNRALDAYHSVLAKDYVLREQQGRIDYYLKLRTDAGQNPQLFQTYKRVVEKEQEKLAAFKDRADDTVLARIKGAQIFSMLGKHDETRMVMNYLEQRGLATEPEQKKLVLYYTARSYAAQNLAAKAEEKYNAFQAAYKGDPLGQDLPLLMGAMYLGGNPKLKDPDKAMKYFAEAAQLYPNTKVGAAAVLMQTQAMIQLKRYDEALKVLNETLAKNPPKELAVDAEFFRATIFAETGKKTEAVAGYKKVRDGFPGTPQAEQSHFQVGQLLSGMDAKAAVGELQSFIAKFSQSTLVPAAIFALGNSQNAAGQKDAALATFKNLAAKFPKSPPAPFAYFERAKILNASQKPDECLAVMREFINGYGDNPALYQAYDFVAQIHTSQGKPAEAIATYEEYAEKHGKDPNAAEALLKLSTLWKAHAESQGPYLALGNDETKRGEWRKGVEKSTAAGERVLAGFPDSPAVALALKNLLDVQRLQQAVKLKTEAEVEKYFEELAAKFAGHPGTKAKIVFTLAAFTFEKDKARAVQQMGGAYKPDLKFAPEDLDLYGLALIDGKKYDEAIAAYEKLAKDYPLSATGTGPRDVQEAQAIALAGWGKALQEKGDKAGGAAKFAELEKLYPWSPKMLEVNYGLALDLHEKKQDDDAIKRLLEVIKAQKASAELRARSMLLLGKIHEANERYAPAIDNYVKISVYYGAVKAVAAEGLWLGAQLLERQATGEIPMPTPPPKAAATPKATPAKK